MPSHRRRTRWSISVLCAAGMCLSGTVVAPAANASTGAERAEARESRAAERASRAAERLARAEERRAARAQQKAQRIAARAERRAARHHEGAQGTAGQQTAASESAGSSASETQAPVSEAGGQRCSVTVTASRPVVTAGQTAEISGLVACAQGVQAASQRVTMYETQPGPQAAASTAASTATTAPIAADGSYSFTSAALTANTRFHVHVGGRGAQTIVKVAPRVTLAMPQPSTQPALLADSKHVARRGRVTFVGTVAPYQAGALVELQVAYASGPDQWRTVAYGHVADDGSYSIAHNFQTPGETLVRAVAHAGKQKVPAASETLTYEAAQPQNPKLTIIPSSAPLLAGGQLTIKGVASGAANQTVTLLGRSPDGPASVLATTTTDGEGNYTFTQEPLQNTYYRVIDAKATSTSLFEQVRLTVTPDPITTPVLAGQTVSFTGVITPGGSGLTVRLERENLSGTAFTTVTSSTSTDESRYTMSATFAKPGTYTMRVELPYDGEHGASASPPFTVQVTE